MKADQINPNGELAEAIRNAVSKLETNDLYGSELRVATWHLNEVFRRTQGNAEYESWLTKEPT